MLSARNPSWTSPCASGGGLDTYVTENIVVALDVTYVLPFGDLDDYDYFSLGLGVAYRF